MLSQVSMCLDHRQVIGATTIEEYRKYIEKDKALERRHLAGHMRALVPFGG